MASGEMERMADARAQILADEAYRAPTRGQFAGLQAKVYTKLRLQWERNRRGTVANFLQTARDAVALPLRLELDEAARRRRETPPAPPPAAP